MLISLDTETTGLDLVHGAMPFLITSCDDKKVIRFVEWDVDPLTREPDIQQGDVDYFAKLIDDAELIYLHNSQFDARVLAKIGIQLPWHKVRDSFVAAHILGSNLSHNLTDSCTLYLGRNIEKFELEVKEVVKECRNIVKKKYPTWRIAKEGEEDMPSIKPSSKRDEDKPWKNDMWLPRALLKEHYKDRGDKLDKASSLPWLEKLATSCSRYANTDSEYTLPLGLEMENLIRQRGYWKHYEHRLALMQADCEMVSTGVTVIGNYTEDTIQQYTEHCAESASALTEIADSYGHTLDLAKGASLNDNMRNFFYGSVILHCPRCDHSKTVKHWNGEGFSQGEVCPKCLKGGKRKQSVRQSMKVHQRPNLNLPIIESKKTGNASLDKDAMQEYLGTLDGEAYEFIKILIDKRKHETDLMYMQSYKRFWVPTEHPDYYRIHPSINPCGTDHLRQSSNSPNLQNVGGQEDKCEECEGKGCQICNNTGKSRMSVKYCFGPAPGREWYCMDYRSIEARLPACEANEPKMVEVFEKSAEGPYWGNLYNLAASILYPDEYWSTAHKEGLFRELYPKLYKKAKFFILAKNYGAGRKKGDLLTGIIDSYDLFDNELPMLAALQSHILKEAQKTGYVQTIPSRAIDPDRGYPILASRTEDNYVLSTTPFNYHISGTACECKNLALVRCSLKCAEWRREGFDARLILEVHDELDFDFPQGEEWDSNLWRAMELKRLMEQSGEDLIPRIPTPVKVTYHARTWAEGRDV